MAGDVHRHIQYISVVCQKLRNSSDTRLSEMKVLLLLTFYDALRCAIEIVEFAAAQNVQLKYEVKAETNRQLEPNMFLSNVHYE